MNFVSMRKYILLFLFVFTASFVDAQSQKIKVACIGNSITEGNNIEGGMRYPQQLAVMLGQGYEVKNFGKSGRTLLRKGDYPYWNEMVLHEALEWQPDIIVFKLGTNDSKPQNWKFKDEFYGDYKSLVDTFKLLSNHPRILLCNPVPVFKDQWGITASVVHDEIIPLLRKLAKEEEAERVDLYKALLPYPNLFPDGVHPNKDGATIMAKTIAEAIGKKSHKPKKSTPAR